MYLFVWDLWRSPAILMGGASIRAQWLSRRGFFQGDVEVEVGLQLQSTFLVLNQLGKHHDPHQALVTHI